jgi:hypothetical protein
MSNPSTQQENGIKPDNEVLQDFLDLAQVLTFTALFFSPGLFASPSVDRPTQEWRQAHAGVVGHDFGKGVQFSAGSKESADASEAIQPALTAGLAKDVYPLVFP